MEPAFKAHFNSPERTRQRIWSTSVSGPQLFTTITFSGTNADRVGDEALSLNSRFNIARQTEHLSLNFGYTPFFQLYRQFSQYDRLNQNGESGLGGSPEPAVHFGIER